jgi:hypothetical protein
LSSKVVRFMRSSENRLCGFLGGRWRLEWVPSRRHAPRLSVRACASHASPRRGVPPYLVSPAVAWSGEAPIFRIEAATHQPPLGDRFYFLESRDADGGFVRDQRGALVTDLN